MTSISLTTWRKAIEDERQASSDNSPIVAVAPSTLDLDRPFDSGYGATEGEPFTLWTEQRVYFPTSYDGSEWVASVPRHPCAEVTHHVG